MVQSVIVVGGGIIGAATALQLSRAGHSVMVVSDGESGATGAAFGWINASFYLDHDHHHLRAAGIAAWHRVIDQAPVTVAWQGCLCWDMQADEMQSTYDQLRDLNYPVEMLDQSQVAAREPALRVAPKQALYFPSEGAVSSDLLAAQFLTAAQALGARLISNVHVAGLKTRNGRVIGIETATGDMLADLVVIAAGTGTSKLAAGLGVEIPMVPRPAYIMRTTPVEMRLNHILATPQGEIRQEPSGQLLMPVAMSHQSDGSEVLHQSPDAAADAALLRLRGTFSGLETAQWSEVTQAARPVPGDGRPVVGAIAEGAYVAVLHSGITLGPIIAELIAMDIAGRLDNVGAAMLAPYRPNRFSLS